MLKQKINDDLKNSLKSGNRSKTDVLRLLNAAIQNKQIELRGQGKEEELTDEQVIQVLLSEAKKRKDSIEAFGKGERPDLADKEQEELKIIQGYLPKQLSPEEVESEVKSIIETLLFRDNARDKQVHDISFGDAMKAATSKLKGRADGKLISEIVKKVISDL